MAARSVQGDIIAIPLPGWRHDDHSVHTRQVHLEKQRLLANRIRFLRILRPPRWPWAVRSIRLPDMHLRINDIHEYALQSRGQVLQKQ